MTHTIRLLIALSLAVAASFSNAQTAGSGTSCPAWLDQDMRRLGSSEVVNLCDAYFGKPILVVNTASNCGYTGQFADLEKLHQRYSGLGLQVIGFPSDSFFQEYEDEEKTAEVCYLNYGVTFDMFAEIPVRGGSAHPLFAGLASQTKAPSWNFFKYLIDSEGNVVQAFSSGVKPDDEELVSVVNSVLLR